MINLYDKVLLQSGETAFIVEIYEQGKAYEADINKNGEIITDTILQNDIKQILE